MVRRPPRGEGSPFGVGEDDLAGGGDLVGDVRQHTQRDPPVRPRPQLPAKVEPSSAEQQLEVGEQLGPSAPHRPRVQLGRQQPIPAYLLSHALPSWPA